MNKREGIINTEFSCIIINIYIYLFRSYTFNYQNFFFELINC